MSFTPYPSLTHERALTQVSAQLAAHAAVTAVLHVGSTGAGRLSDHSDYDLLLFCRSLPVPLHVLFTTIDGTLTDVIFQETAVLTTIQTAPDLSALSQTIGDVMAWLRDGRIVHDGDGAATAAQQRLRQETWRQTIPETAAYQAWQKINYNWQQTRRMLAADDAVYRTAVGMRLLYMVADLYVAYFHVRGMGWRGEKEAVRYWQQHDPEFLELLHDFVAQTAVAAQFKLYQRLAAHTLAPVGGLWTEPITTVTLHPAAAGETAERDAAFAFWQELTGAG